MPVRFIILGRTIGERRMPTEVRCPDKDCRYNRFYGICTKNVLTLKKNVYNRNLYCQDKEGKD
jgi:hypothetical protein